MPLECDVSNTMSARSISSLNILVSNLEGGNHTVKNYQYSVIVLQDVKQLQVTNIYWKVKYYKKWKSLFEIKRNFRLKVYVTSQKGLIQKT